ncbi:MAG: hypothetical protein PHC66_04540 [Candidatus Nanoarchaeia archaeon]|nr:hypothetical protein [Candidatus Nanoarchaeia archaeon]MDD5239773.1 hypothetical protein [Candidatus Nanoarchaeia archaeon]
MVEVLSLIAQILLEGVNLFISPIFHLEMLWIVIPVILSWVFAEFFQEKLGTDMGNAISNGVVALWAGIDWTRNLMSQFSGFSMDFIMKEGLCVLLFIYGALVVVLGLKGKGIIKYVGRIREVTYLILAFTPVVYGYYELNLLTLAAIAVYFPVFYIIIEIIDRLTPTPEWEKESKDEGLDLPKDELQTELGTGLEGADVFGEKKPAQQAVQQPAQQQGYACPTCRGQLTYIPQYQRYYCYNCKKYI